MVSVLLIMCLLGVSSYGMRTFIKGSYFIGGAVTVLALVGVVFVVHPEYSTMIANYAGIGRGADLLLYLFFMLSVVLILLIHAKFERQNVLITDLARSIALNTVKSMKNCNEPIKGQSE